MRSATIPHIQILLETRVLGLVSWNEFITGVRVKGADGKSGEWCGVAWSTIGKYPMCIFLIRNAVASQFNREWCGVATIGKSCISLL